MKSPLDLRTATPFIILAIIVAASIAFSLWKHRSQPDNAASGNVHFYKQVQQATSLQTSTLSFDSAELSTHSADEIKAKRSKRSGSAKKNTGKPKRFKHGKDAIPASPPRDFLSDTIPRSR